MQTDDSLSASIIPSLLKEMMRELPVRSGEFTLNLSTDASITAIQEVFRRLLTAEKKMTVRTRFQMGDAYNQIEKHQGKRNVILAPIYAEFGKQYGQLFRTYGWVARKWQDTERNDKKPWYWFVEHYRDANGVIQKGKERDIRIPEVTPLAVCSERRVPDGSVVFFGEDASGRRYSMDIPVGSNHTIYHITPDYHQRTAEYATEEQAEEFETA